MKAAIKKGFNFGVTSGVITTLGLIIGLAFSTQSRIAVIGGVITIAVADALSDALGMHISEESDGKKSIKHIWATTISTAVYKFLFAISFLIPILLFNMGIATILSIIWGVFLITMLSYNIAKKEGTATWKPITEHLTIAAVVIVVTYFLGIWVRNTFI